MGKDSNITANAFNSSRGEKFSTGDYFTGAACFLKLLFVDCCFQ
jgi:hypothetical protein